MKKGRTMQFIQRCFFALKLRPIHERQHEANRKKENKKAGIIMYRNNRENQTKNSKKVIFPAAFICAASMISVPAAALESETIRQEEILISDSEQMDCWVETYTYRSDTQDHRAFPEVIEKNGVRYEVSDVQYQVTELTKQFAQSSPDLWAYAAYEPSQEIEVEGVSYTLERLDKEEWTQGERLKNVALTRTYLEGQEIAENLDIETQDDVTGETIYAAIPRTDVKEDGAGWWEGGLEQWIEYIWNDGQWAVEVGGEYFAATEESPWFEGCEGKLLEYLNLDSTFNQITSVAWYDDGWQDESGTWKRSARVGGNRMIRRYQATYSGDVSLPDLPMVRYTAHYNSDVQGYLITANVTYEKTESPDPAGIVTADLTETAGTTDSSGISFQYLLLVALTAVGIGLQTAVILVLARLRSNRTPS